MTYNAFLDFFFSAGWYAFGFVALCVILFVVFKKQLYDNRKRKKLITFFIYAIPILWLITYGLFNPKFFGYGRPVAVTSITMMNGKLLVVDYILTAGGKSSRGEACYRMHNIDPATGEKKRRFRIGSTTIFVATHGDTLVISHYDDVSFYSLTTGDELAVWSKETLPGLFPQLAAGVLDFSCSGGTQMVYVNSLDGQKWKLNSLTNTIASYKEQGENEKYTPTGKWYIEKDEVKIDNKEYGTTLLSLDGEDGNDNLEMIYNSNDSLLNRDLKFIGGKPVAVSEKANCFVVLHYETLAKEKFILTAISLDGKKKLWEIKQSDLAPGYTLEKSEEISVSGNDTELFFCLSKELFSAQLKDGKLLWRTKL